MKKKLRNINCNDCIGLFITHDPKRRWGCKFFGFKSNYIPSIEVKRVTGTKCAYFLNKESVNQLPNIEKINSNGRLA